LGIGKFPRHHKWFSSPPASSSSTLTSELSASRRATTEPDEPDPQTIKSYCGFKLEISLPDCCVLVLRTLPRQRLIKNLRSLFNSAQRLFVIKQNIIFDHWRSDFLKRELKGYEAYTEKVRYRLIPFVW
jgi:hypothetical protein